MADGGWDKLQIIGPLLVAWTALTALVANWWKSRNERKRDVATEEAGDWQRLRAERDHALELAESRRLMLIECERISIERLGRAVIAEAENVGLNKLLERATILPGSEGPSSTEKPDA